MKQVFEFKACIESSRFMTPSYHNVFSSIRSALIPLRWLTRSMLTGVICTAGMVSVGCDDTSEPQVMSGHMHDADGHAGDHAHHAGDHALEECGMSDAGCFDEAWSITGELYSISLVSASPTSPERGESAWRVQVQRDDAPQAGCAITLTPYMPEHGHGVPLAPTVSDAGAGLYQIDGISFTMPGLWEMRFEISCGAEGDTGDLTEELVYEFWLNS